MRVSVKLLSVTVSLRAADILLHTPSWPEGLSVLAVGLSALSEKWQSQALGEDRAFCISSFLEAGFHAAS